LGGLNETELNKDRESIGSVENRETVYQTPVYGSKGRRKEGNEKPVTEVEDEAIVLIIR
jgi:hypothetical protein